MLERSLQSKQPLIRRADEPLGPLGAAMGFNPSYSSIAALMGSDDQPLGVLTLAHHQDGRYGSEAQAITAILAGNIPQAPTELPAGETPTEQAPVAVRVTPTETASENESGNNLTLIIGGLLAVLVVGGLAGWLLGRRKA